jgi:NAD(P)-dependent dehydrogenase (short-subunit alcohol dehydrogenase family)
MLKGKTIVVTGGNGLIGSGIIKQAQQKSASVICIDIKAGDNDADFFQCDITDAAAIASTVTEIWKKYRKIDGWVNCAYPRTADWGLKFEEIPLASWEKNINLQLNSVFYSCQLVLPKMAQQKNGSLVNIASIYGEVAPDFSVYEGTAMTMPAAYSAIKGGIINFSRYLAAYYGPSGIRVNCVSPGGIFDHQPDSFVKKYESKVPLRRMGKSEDIAPAVTFLLSDEAAYITGHNLMVDGGWTAV